MTTKEVLTKARAELARRGGWVKNELVDDAGRCCALGALSKVQGRYEDNAEGDKYWLYPAHGGRANRALRSALIEMGGGDDIIHWNDRSTTRKKDVLELYDRAIAAA